MFTHIFGDSPRVRVLDFLADYPDFDYNISFVSREAHVSRPTLYRLLDELVEERLVKVTRTVGQSRFYQLDTDSQVIRLLLQADFTAINEAQDREEAASRKVVTRPSPTAPRRARRDSGRR